MNRRPASDHTQFAARSALMCAVVVLGGRAVGQTELPTGKQVIARYCVACHGPELQEAGLRLDSLDSDEPPGRKGKTLQRVLRAVRDGEMPPSDSDQPSWAEREGLRHWLEVQLDGIADELRGARSETMMRRLTGEEYNYTMQSLFGVDAECADLLPPDPISEMGYRNATDRLGLSSIRLDAYLDSARRAISRYVQSGDLEGQSLFYHIEFEELYYAAGDRYGTRAQAPWPVDRKSLGQQRKDGSARPGYAQPLSSKRPGAYSADESMRAAIPKLNEQFVAVRQRLSVGELLVRVRAAATPDRVGRFPRLRVEAGVTLGDGCSIDKRLLGETDVTAPLDAPEVFEFHVRLEDVPTKGALTDEETFDRLSVFDLDQFFISNATCDERAIFALGRGGFSDPKKGLERAASHIQQMAADGVGFLYLDWIEIEMLPGVGERNHAYRWAIPQVAEAEEAVASGELILEFMRAAFRRPVSQLEVQAKLELFHQLRTLGYSFDQSLKETMAAVLVSPSFLFRDAAVERRRRPDSDRVTTSEPTSSGPSPHQLATRLSYLLWLSPPDEQLMMAADRGTLAQPETLHNQIDRLLADPRSRRFTESFCRQWLRLDKYRNVVVNRERFSSYDEDLAADALRETLGFFHEVFSSEASALDLLDSSYAILNHRLARHYGLDVASTGQLARVDLPGNSIRGGLLTHASLLTMNSDGTDSHPIRRGVWLLERLLHDPPPPPPPNVPAIERNVLDEQELSLAERIELHRRPGACRGCHEKIDPWGMALEAFDATGGWRGGNESQGPSVPSSRSHIQVVLPDGTGINNVAQFKSYLREHQAERFADSMVHHMFTFTFGREPDLSDRQYVKTIRQRFMASGYRLKALLLAIIDCPLFQRSAP